VLGGIALRYGAHEQIPSGGNIGYGIRPSARRQGLAAWALAQILGEARRFGMDHVRLVCAADNVASARTIDRQGGVLESIEPTERGLARRYRIDLTCDNSSAT
jgi:predicted acetyltransferase